MPTKCCWVIHGSLTSERKASTSPSSFINHSTLLLPSAKLLACTSKFERSTGSESERVDALGLRAVEVIICMITRDFSVISMTSHASLSLSLPLTKVTDAQYRKRFRASYNYYRSNCESNVSRSATFDDHDDPSLCAAAVPFLKICVVSEHTKSVRLCTLDHTKRDQ